MRHLCTLVFALGTLLGLGPAAIGQDKVRILDVRVGFSRGDEDFFKVGTWVPVAVDVAVMDEAFEGSLTVETDDGDGVKNSYTLPRPIRVTPDERQRTFLTYTKLGSSYGDMKVTVEGEVGRKYIRRSFDYPENRPNSGAARSLAVPSGTMLILGIGQPKGLEAGEVDQTQANLLAERGYRVAFQTDLTRLPEHWFAYESADVIILPTGGQWQGSLVQALMLESGGIHRTALTQWVEMGGHLVVSVGQNHSFVGNPQSFPLERLLPAQVDTKETVKVERLQGVKDLVEKLRRERRLSREGAVKAFGVEMARLTPRGVAQPEAFEKDVNLPSIVSAPYGRGRVTLLAFDTDQGPFTFWDGRRDFWTALLDIKVEQQARNMPQWNRWNYDSQDMAAQLSNLLDQFGEVKVIPFWWVALFILGYIFVVGPLDYLFLKKVVKRLTGHERMEWTWFTFPAVVLVVSLGAYYLAYYLKGDELRINKVDLVDIDLRTQQLYGNTWFTVFSPRLQHYNIGVKPTGLDSKVEALNVSWMGRPGEGARSLGRNSSPGLFQRTYRFEDDMHRLEGVPIHVWSMKSFTARWETDLAKAAPIRYSLTAPDSKTLVGTVTSDLPVTLKTCKLIFHGKAWDLGDLEKGKAVSVPKDSRDIGSLSGGLPAGSPRLEFNRLSDLMMRIMFFKSMPRQSNEHNDYLAYLDQTWRQQLYPEAILVGVLEANEGQAEAMNLTDRFGCRLEPFDPALRGTIKQFTFVRAFIPILKRGADAEAAGEGAN